MLASACRGRSLRVLYLPSCDRDDVAEHPLACEMRSGARSGDRDLSNRAGVVHHGIGDAVDFRQRVIGVNDLRLHASGHGPRAIWPGERERRDVPDPLSSRCRLACFPASDAGDAEAGDLLAFELPETSAERIITFAVAS